MSREDYTTKVEGAQERAHAYLLGELDDAEQFRFERDYLADEGTYDSYLAAQDELIESYLEGELSPARRERFERHFLVTEERRERLRLIRDLNASALTSLAATVPLQSREPGPLHKPEPYAPLASLLRAIFGPPRRRLAFAGMAAALVLICFMVWRLMPEQREVPGELATTAPPVGQTGRTDAPVPPPPAPSGDRPVNQAPRPRPAPTPEAVTRRAPRPPSYALILSPVSLRDAGGDETHTLRLPRAADGTLHLRLLLEDAGDLSTVRGQVSTAEGALIHAGGDLNVRRGRTSFVTLKLPTASLADGDYIVRLMGPAADGAPLVARFAFRVMRR